MAVKRETRNIFLYAAPFATWIGLQMVLPVTAWAYAVRAAATALVGVWCLWYCRRGDSEVGAPCRGDRVVGSPRRSDRDVDVSAKRPYQVATGLLAGVLVAVLWIVPEISPFYRMWFCWPLGSLPTASTDPSPYDPAVCGWTLTIAKLVGSAFVIAPVEEVFFRSFLYRWLQKRDFLSIPLARFNLSAFLWMVFLFTLEHDRPLAAALAGAVYGFTAIRWGLASAIIAHVTTNMLLALHVIFSGAWAFW